MTTYAYKCPSCLNAETFDAIHDRACCVECEVELIRDWKSEGVVFTRVPGGARS